MGILRHIVSITFFVSVLSFGLDAQVDTNEVYHNSRRVSILHSYNVEKLSEALAKPCSSDEEMVLAFAYWICKNIKYDYAAYEKRSAEVKSIKKVLRSRKALSDGYTKLFVELCNLQKVPAIYVPGYMKEYDYVAGDTLYRAEYAWALVKLGDEWNIMDLTAAAGKVKEVVGPLSKVLWTLFKIPYSSHLVSVKEYEPSYLYVKPERNVKTRFPVIDDFQLLTYPVPMSSFMAGDSLVDFYLATYPGVRTNDLVLDRFSEISLLDKNLYFAENVTRNNPFCQFTQAMNYYYAVKIFFNTYYLSEKGKIFAPLEESKKALVNLQRADSLFVIATQNNVKEQVSKQVRSEYWKRNLVESNKVLSAQLGTQAKVNSQQTRTIGKIQSLAKKMQSYFAKYKDKYKLRDIIDLPKPMIQNKEYLDEGVAKINRCLELNEERVLMLREYDSLMAPLLKIKIDSAYYQQQNASRLCNEELRSLSRYLDRKSSNLSLVYYSDKYVFKKGYFEMFAKVGNINDTYTDPAIETIAERLPQVFDLIQRYVAVALESFELLKAAKVILANDYGEDDMYEKMALAFNAQLDVFGQQITDIMDFDTKMTECLDNDVSMYKDIVKMLQNDNSIESYRHKEYMNYRKSVKQAENDKIKYYQETLKNYQKLISKAVYGK